MVPLSKYAPTKPAAVATVNDSKSVVVTIQLPFAFCVAPGIVQPDGRLLIVVVICVPTAAEFVRPRFMGSPAMPAGATWKLELLLSVFGWLGVELLPTS